MYGFIIVYIYIYVIVVTQAGVHCPICTHEPEGVQHPRASADISGNARMPVLQLICNTSGTLKICPNLPLNALLFYIVSGTHPDHGFSL